jgi:hypothetical protein
MILPISKETGESFVKPFCDSIGVGTEGRYTGDYPLHWFGYYRGNIPIAVLALLKINGYDYVYGFYGEKRGLIKIWHWATATFPKLLGKIDKANTKMLRYVKRHGWETYKEFPDCYLVRGKNERNN